MAAPQPFSWFDLVPLFAGVASLGTAYLAYHLLRAGALTRAEVQTEVLGPYLVLHKPVVGPYSNTGRECAQLTKIITDIGLVHAGDIGKISMIGVFYDNPKTTHPSKCRSSLGYVFKSGLQVMAPEDIAKHRRWLSNLSMVNKGELQVGFFPASRCLAVSSPLNGWLSVLLAVMRSYPRLDQAFNKAQQKEGKAAGAVPHQLQGALEVYCPAEGKMWVAYPLTDRKELTPFKLPDAVPFKPSTDGSTPFAAGAKKAQ